MTLGDKFLRLDKENIYELLYHQEKATSNKHDSLPPTTSDTDINITSQVNNDMSINYGKNKVSLDPEMLNHSLEEIEEMMGYAMKHLRWHPNHGLGFHTNKFNSAGFSQTKGLENYTITLNDNEVQTPNPKASVRDIYHNAIEEFSYIFETDFEAPQLIFDDSVIEKNLEKIDKDPEDVAEVGYNINPENNEIVLNNGIITDMHPNLLNNDFRYMLKRYHDLSLEQTVREKVIPYVEKLRPDTDLELRNAVFADKDQGEGSYSPENGRLEIDYSNLKSFNPKTGIFEPDLEGLPGSAILLHEEIHDLDFSVNEFSRKYLNSVYNTDDVKDPRNAVLEAPTTFEVLMAGWNTREKALNAFNQPTNHTNFFRSYPAQEFENNGQGLTDPYNMGLFTALSIHNDMMNNHGLEEGTRKTRDILYDNKWDLSDMEQMLEESFDSRNVPNIPRHRREVIDIIENGDPATEAEKLLEKVENGDEDAQARGLELTHEYQERHGLEDAPEPIFELGATVKYNKRGLDQYEINT